jgi:hypothetical protein
MKNARKIIHIGDKVNDANGVVGTIVALPKKGYFSVKMDDGREYSYMPVEDIAGVGCTVHYRAPFLFLREGP